MKKILLQLDTDAHASSFDAVTAIDAGVDQLLQYYHVNTSNVTPLVQGGIFTRAPKDLHRTALFVGGSDVESGEAVFRQVLDCFFGPMRVSVMMDSNGCNTTAAAAVIYINKHLNLSDVKALVLGGTGPVGRRVASILTSQGAAVTLASRSISKAQKVCSQIADAIEAAKPPIPVAIPEDGVVHPLLTGHNVVLAAGATGVQFCTLEDLEQYSDLKLAIDLNAVPPLGIQGIESMDKARQVGELLCYGAVGIGGLKMKIHHAIVQQLFESNTSVFDTAEIYQAAVKMG